MPEERFLVTGALGCIGAWVVHELIHEGVAVTTFDAGDDAFRLRCLLSDDELAAVTRLRGDVTDGAAVRSAVVDGGITNVIHLAGLQVPFCAADPPLGARVNVVGTINVFEAVRGTAAEQRPIAYSSSIAAYHRDDAPEPGRADPSGRPETHYGVFKLANEANARVYAQSGVSSVGLRPAVVYGVGRDQGMTSTPTGAMLAAVCGRPATITFSGACQMHYAPDVARTFIAATRSEPLGAEVFNLGGPSTDMREVLDAIREAEPEGARQIRIDGDPLPFPPATPSDGLAARIGERPQTGLQAGVAETMERLRALVSEGTIPRVTAA
jgi:UDP-glucuronate 4-epimerase